MKKNAMLKIAAVLLVAVLLTTCAISSTFAKYATYGGKHEEEARVAKWGVTASLKVITAGDTLFDTSYGSGEKYVKSSDDKSVVAPGAKGSITIEYKVIGTPEVSMDVIFRSDKDVTKVSDKNFFAVSNAGTLKDELIFSIKDGKSDATTLTPVDGYTNVNYDKVNEYLQGLDTPYTVGTKYEVDKKIEISWEWKFEDGTTATEKATADKNDTSLGDAAAKNQGPVITFNMFLDVVQTGAAGAKA